MNTNYEVSKLKSNFGLHLKKDGVPTRGILKNTFLKTSRKNIELADGLLDEIANYRTYHQGTRTTKKPLAMEINDSEYQMSKSITSSAF